MIYIEEKRKREGGIFLGGRGRIGGDFFWERKEKGELFWIVGGFFFEKKHAATRRE